MRDQGLQEARVLDIASRVEEDLDLGWITIVHKFSSQVDVDRVVGETMCDWEYRSASVLWNVVLVATMTDDMLRDTMIHELVHILLAPIWNELSSAIGKRLSKNNEFATENIARAIASALETPVR